MIDALGAATTVGVAILASAVTYGINVRSTHIADAGGRSVADSRLLEVVQLLLPPLKSGTMAPSNMTILGQRVAKLDDPLIVGAYRKNPRALQLIGQVEIAVARMSITAERGESSEKSTRNYAQVGIENALLAISHKTTRLYAEAIAKHYGFERISEEGPRVIAQYRATVQSNDRSPSAPESDGD